MLLIINKDGVLVNHQNTDGLECETSDDERRNIGKHHNLKNPVGAKFHHNLKTQDIQDVSNVELVILKNLKQQLQLKGIRVESYVGMLPGVLQHPR